MSLQKQQDFLARLFTDESLRQNFLSDPEKIGAANGLSEKETADLTTVLPEQLNFFAESLYRKRLHEAEKILPLTKAVCGADFARRFRDFAGGYNPQKVNKHLEDALEFCLYLQHAETPAAVKDAARYERARFLFSLHERAFVFEIFDHDIRKFFKEIAAGDKIAENELRPRKTFAIWFRIGKIKKHFMI